MEAAAFLFWLGACFRFGIQPSARTKVVMTSETYLRVGNAFQSPHRSPFDLLSNPVHSLCLPQPNPPQQQPQCSSLAFLLPSWLSVSSIVATRFDRRSLTSLIVLAAASTLASPIPAGSFSKKEVTGVKYNILAREPEVQGSDLDILARDPESVEARDPICTPRMCS